MFLNNTAVKAKANPTLRQENEMEGLHEKKRTHHYLKVSTRITKPLKLLELISLARSCRGGEREREEKKRKIK